MGLFHQHEWQISNWQREMPAFRGNIYTCAVLICPGCGRVKTVPVSKHHINDMDRNLIIKARGWERKE